MVVCSTTRSSLGKARILSCPVLTGRPYRRLYRGSPSFSSTQNAGRETRVLPLLGPGSNGPAMQPAQRTGLPCLWNRWWWISDRRAVRCGAGCGAGSGCGHPFLPPPPWRGWLHSFDEILVRGAFLIRKYLEAVGSIHTSSAYSIIKESSAREFAG